MVLFHILPPRLILSYLPIPGLECGSGRLLSDRLRSSDQDGQKFPQSAPQGRRAERALHLQCAGSDDAGLPDLPVAWSDPVPSLPVPLSALTILRVFSQVQFLRGSFALQESEAVS